MRKIRKNLAKNFIILLTGVVSGQFLAVALALGTTIFTLGILTCILLVEDEEDPPNAH